MKVLAYTSQHGDLTITPLSAKSRGISTLYSRHPAGQRIEMYVNRRGNNHFFAYKGDRSPSDVSEPESLTHAICKTVLKEWANQNIQTQLHLTHRTQKLQPFTITLQAGRDEFRIDVPQTRYFIDVFCKFEQTEDPYLLSYECKWNGQIAFEFCHANGLSASDRKCKDLEHLGIPIIQILVKKGSFFDVDEEILIGLSDEEVAKRIEQHKSKVGNAFKKRIVGVLFNAPESKAYAETSIFHQAVERLTQQNAELLLSNEDLNTQNTVLSAAHEELAQSLAEVEKELHWNQGELARTAAELNSQQHQVCRLNEQLQRKQEHIKSLQTSEKPGFWKKWFG